MKCCSKQNSKNSENKYNRTTITTNKQATNQQHLQSQKATKEATRNNQEPAKSEARTKPACFCLPGLSACFRRPPGFQLPSALFLGVLVNRSGGIQLWVQFLGTPEPRNLRWPWSQSPRSLRAPERGFTPNVPRIFQEASVDFLPSALQHA